MKNYFKKFASFLTILFALSAALAPVYRAQSLGTAVRIVPVPDGAFYSRELHEFVLPYNAARRSAAPHRAVLQFLESTYAAAADLGHWDRAALERPARLG